MSRSNQLKNQHLLWRAGFGPAVEQLDNLDKISSQTLYRAIQKASSKKPEYIQAADNYLQGLMMGIQDVGKQQRQEMSPEQRKELQRKSREGIKNLNLYWVKEMVNTDAQLREKMSFFWHTASSEFRVPHPLAVFARTRVSPNVLARRRATWEWRRHLL